MALCLVDAFAEVPFSGNPAAVAFLEAYPPDTRLQAIAAELGWSETAFVVARGDGDHELRWFTPRCEVELCGHATLAAAHLLGGSARFHTRSGLLTCVADAALLRRLEPDLAALAGLGTRCVILSAPGDRGGLDCVSRVFAPNAGIAEDPVTGSAHCTLADYWGERLGRDVLCGEQASRRGGLVRMRRDAGRVHLAGRAVTVARIELVV